MRKWYLFGLTALTLAAQAVLLDPPSAFAAADLYFDSAFSVSVTNGPNATDADATTFAAITNTGMFTYATETPPNTLTIKYTGSGTVYFYDSFGGSSGASVALASSTTVIDKAITVPVGTQHVKVFSTSGVNVYEVTASGTSLATPVPTVPTSGYGLGVVPGDGAAKILWQPLYASNYPKGIVSGYHVWRDGTLLATVPLAGANSSFTPLESRSYEDSGLLNGQSYQYQVSAFNVTGDAAKSPAVAATPVSPGAFAYDAAHTPAGTTSPEAAIDASFSTLAGGGHFALTTNPPKSISVLASGGTVHAYDSFGNQTSLTAATSTDYSIASKSMRVSQYNLPATTRHIDVFGGSTYQITAVGPIQPIAAPVAPSKYALTGLGSDGGAFLSWQASNTAYYPKGIVDGYHLYRNGSLISSFPLVDQTDSYYKPLRSLWYIDSALTNGATYSYQVAAYNSAGEAAKSELLSVTPDVASKVIEPDLLHSGGVTDHTLAIDGDYTSSTGSGGHHYQFTTNTPPKYLDIYTNGNPSVQVWDTLGTTQTDLNPTSIMQYRRSATEWYDIRRYTIPATTKYFNVAGAAVEMQAIAPAQTPPPPIKAVHPAFQGIGANNAAKLMWQDDTSGIVEGYRIYRDGVLIGTAPLAPVRGGAIARPDSWVTFLDQNVTNGTTYTYEMTAYNASGESAKTAVTVTPNQPGVISYDASHSTNSADMLNPEFAVDGDTSTALTGPIGGYYAAFTVNTDTLAQVDLLSRPFSGFYAVDATGKNTSLNPTPWMDYNNGSETQPWTRYYRYTLPAGTVYFYMTSMSGPLYEITPVGKVTIAAPTSSPTNVTTTVSGTTVSLAWAKPSGVVTGYNVYRDGLIIATVQSPNYADTTVTMGQTYSYTTSAYNATGEGPQSPATTVTVDSIPNTPTDVVAQAGDGSVLLNWTAPATGGSQTGFRVYRDNVQIADIAGANYLDTTAVNGVSYAYQVTAYNSLGESEKSAATSAMPNPPAPGAPGAASSQATSTGATITWSAPTDGSVPTGYNVYRDGALVGTTTGSTMSFTDSGLSPNTTYTYVVKAYNAASESATGTSTTVTTLPALPDAPMNFSGTPQNQAALLTWTVPTTGGTIEGFNLYRDGTLLATLNSPTPAPVASLLHQFSLQAAAIATNAVAASPSGLPTSYTDTGLTPGVAYTYELAGYNASGASQKATTTVTIANTAPPSAPVNLQAASGDASVLLTWEPPATGDVPTSYRVYRDGQPVGEVTDSSFMDAALINGTKYTYAVNSVTAAGESPAAIVEATPTLPPDYVTPGVPDGVSVAPQSDKLVLTWQTPSNGGRPTEYRVYRDGVLIATTMTNVFTDTGVTPGVVYHYAVCAANFGGASDLSPAVASQTVDGPPGAPINRKAQPGNGSAMIQWDPSPWGGLPDTYEVYRNGTLVGSGLTQPYFMDTNLPNDTPVRYTLRAGNGGGWSEMSGEFSVTPTANPAGTGAPGGSVPGDEAVVLPCETCPVSTVRVKYVTAFSAALTWDPFPPSSAQIFAVYKNGDKIGEVPAAVTNFYVENLQPSTTYQFFIRAIKPDGSSGLTSDIVKLTLPPNTVQGNVASPDQKVAYERSLRVQSTSAKGQSIFIRAGADGFPVATSGTDEVYAGYGSVPGGHRVDVLNGAGVVIGSTRAKPDGSWTVVTREPFANGDTLEIRYRDR